jgi:cytochrome P450
MLSQCVLLLGAGHETTRSLIANALLTLLRHPDLLQRLRGSGGITRTAVEEFLRFEGPFGFSARIAAEDLEEYGHTVRKGEPVFLVLQAANRDPRQFANPDNFDPWRSSNAHLAFGAGAHLCLGNHLARVETEIAINRLLARFPTISLLKEPVWENNFFLRRQMALNVSLQ